MKKNNNTAELPGIPKKRGRPATGKAKTSAERQAEFRSKKRKEGICPCCGQKLRAVALIAEIAKQNESSWEEFDSWYAEHGWKYVSSREGAFVVWKAARAIPPTESDG